MKREQDHFGKAAKKAGYPARSVYKLQEIDTKVKLLKPGMHVLDLGAFPGSWTLYAAEKVGERGKVLGIDVQPFKGALPLHAQMIQEDMLACDPENRFKDERFDVVLSDMAPATTGHRFLDQTRSFNLFMMALGIAQHALKPGGAFVGKIFIGGDFDQAKNEVKKSFEQLKILKPEASRSESYETFIIGLHKTV